MCATLSKFGQQNGDQPFALAMGLSLTPKAKPPNCLIVCKEDKQELLWQFHRRSRRPSSVANTCCFHRRKFSSSSLRRIGV